MIATRPAFRLSPNKQAVGQANRTVNVNPSSAPSATWLLFAFLLASSPFALGTSQCLYLILNISALYLSPFFSFRVQSPQCGLSTGVSSAPGFLQLVLFLVLFATRDLIVHSYSITAI